MHVAMQVVPSLYCCVRAWVAPTAPVDAQAVLHKWSFTGALEEGCAPVIRVGFNFLFFPSLLVALSKKLLCCTCLGWVRRRRRRRRVFCWAKDPLLQGMVGRRDAVSP